jgi:hypothetical protein
MLSTWIELCHSVIVISLWLQPKFVIVIDSSFVEVVDEWVNDCCLTIITAISWREQVNFQWDDDEVRFVLDQHAELDFFSASSMKQQSAGRYVALLGHIIQSQPVFGLSP